jgi:hypothetical protein
MPDIKKYKSVAVPIPTWKKLGNMAEKNHRSPAQQIAFLVDVAEKSPADADVLTMYAKVRNDE